jgi:hypothetical protein
LLWFFFFFGGQNRSSGSTLPILRVHLWEICHLHWHTWSCNNQYNFGGWLYCKTHLCFPLHYSNNSEVCHTLIHFTVKLSYKTKKNVLKFHYGLCVCVCWNTRRHGSPNLGTSGCITWPIATFVNYVYTIKITQ